MGEQSSTRLPRKVDPGKLVGLMEEAGWQPLGGRRGVYKRFSPPSSMESGRGSSSLVIPLDEESPEFSELMHSALQQLSEDSDSWIRLIYPRLLVDASDQFKFR